MMVIDEAPADQVPRWFEFMETYPDIEIASPFLTRGMWKAYLDGEVISVQLDLRRLLDDLEDKLGRRS